MWRNDGWAIGTDMPEPPKDAEATILFIKDFMNKNYKMKPRILYGGSVNSKNIKNYIQSKVIDGALIGGASLTKEEVKAIVAVAE